MLQTLIGVSIAALLALFAASPSLAQAVCGPRTDLARELDRRHDEAPVAMGLASNGSLMEVFSSKHGETWTLVLTMPNGTSCIVAAGEAWARRLPQVAGEIS